MATALKAPIRVAKATGKSAPKPKTVTAKPSMKVGLMGGTKYAQPGASITKIGGLKDTKRG